MSKYIPCERTSFAYQQCLLVGAMFSYLLKTRSCEIMLRKAFEVNLGPFQTSIMELVAKIFNG